MMRSLFSAVSGLRVHQTKMDVIANNISNVNTAGYKSSRVTFYDVFNQTLSGASRASADTGRGGRNPMQIGLGANIASIDQIMTTGATQRTDWAYDVMIQGEGFFIVSDNGGTYFTRAGAFRVDEAGNLTTPQGLSVNGWQRVMDSDPTSPTYGQYTIQKGKVSPIVITPEMEFTDPAPTTKIDMAGNLNAAQDGDGFVTTMAFYDTVGNRYVADVKYTYYEKGYDPGATGMNPEFTQNILGLEGDPIEAGSWIMEIVSVEGKDAYLAEDPKKKFNFNLGFMEYDPDSSTEPIYSGVGDSAANPPDVFSKAVVKFDTFGNIIEPAQSMSNGIGKTNMLTLAIQPDPDMLPAATFGKIVSDPNATTTDQVVVTNDQIIFDMQKMIQKNLLSNATGTAVDGHEPGKLIGTSVGEDGTITGIYSNGETEILAQIAITQFTNPSGLEKIGGSLFRATRNSGDFDGVGMPPGSGGSSLLSGSLEMANVDLSQEFTEMITTQRGFQANSRVITTSDDMLQELVNLKR